MWAPSNWSRAVFPVCGAPRRTPYPMACMPKFLSWGDCIGLFWPMERKYGWWSDCSQQSCSHQRSMQIVFSKQRSNPCWSSVARLCSFLGPKNLTKANTLVLQAMLTLHRCQLSQVPKIDKAYINIIQISVCIVATLFHILQIWKGGLPLPWLRMLCIAVPFWYAKAYSLCPQDLSPSARPCLHIARLVRDIEREP